MMQWWSYTTQQIAEVVHEANRGLQKVNGEVVSPPWDECGEEMQQSAIHGVRVVQEGNEPQELHRQWCMTKEAQGWVLGDVKDAEKKTHPCLVDYDKLPVEQKVKDHLFYTITKTLSG